MFNYSDPVGTGLLAQQNALNRYRTLVHGIDRSAALTAGSAYVERDAFLELSTGATPEVNSVSWFAFPKTANSTDEEIDAQRFLLQDEYVEWRVESNGAGGVSRVTFTTEFPEYYEALAEVSMAALVRGIRETIPGANPTREELFGTNFNPSTVSPRARGARFRSNGQNNPWNNGSKGILFLAHRSNSMSALFGLAESCAVRRPNLDPSAVCGAVGGACVPERNSDPRICLACQNLARAGRGLSIEDPAGVTIARLGGTWEANGQDIAINDPASSGGAWVVSRNGRRAVLNVGGGLTLNGDPITTGAQVAAVLSVTAAVISVEENFLPEWARTGREGTRVQP
jgi:hypothetical protein